MQTIEETKMEQGQFPEPDIVSKLKDKEFLAKDYSQMSDFEKMVAANQGISFESADYKERCNQIVEKYGDVCDPVPWEEFFEEKDLFQGTPVYFTGDKGRVFICMHGAGHSAMSYAVLADRLKREGHSVAAFDFRGHGNHEMQDVEDFSLQVLTKEALAVVEFICNKFKGRSVVLSGHSMGAAVALEVAHHIKQHNLTIEDQLHGFINLDLVEKTAMKMLPKMDMILKKMPIQFNSVHEAIMYRLSENQIQNKIAARVSVPSELKEIQQEDGKVVYKWRVDLQKSKPFWEDWFKGFANKQSQLRLPCIIILADKDYHDDQMLLNLNTQGQNFPMILDCKNTGHFIHQDQPVKVTLFFESFVAHNKIPVDCNEELTITTATGKVIKINRNR